MASAEIKVSQLLQQHGYRLERDRKHQIWRSSQLNIQIVFASTPSDRRAWDNALSDLKRQIAGQPGRGTQTRFVLTPEVSAAFDRTLGKQGIPKPVGGGVQRPAKTRGTGFIYEDSNKQLTPEEVAAKEAEAGRIRAQQAEKRERKLARKQREQAARDERLAVKTAINERRDAAVAEFVDITAARLARYSPTVIRDLEDLVALDCWDAKKFCHLRVPYRIKNARQSVAQDEIVPLRKFYEEDVVEGTDVPSTFLEGMDKYWPKYKEECLGCLAVIPASVEAVLATVKSVCAKSYDDKYFQEDGVPLIDGQELMNRMAEKLEEWKDKDSDDYFYRRKFLRYVLNHLDDSMRERWEEQQKLEANKDVRWKTWSEEQAEQAEQEYQEVGA